MNVATGNRQALKLVQVGYTTKGALAALTAGAGQQLFVHSASAYNANNSTIDVGLGVRFAASSWNFYTLGLTTANTTSSIQAGSTVTALPTTNNYGFYVQAKAPFGFLEMNVSQAETGSPVYEYTYWNGTSFATLPIQSTTVYTATGVVVVQFLPPVDWAQGHNSQLTDMASGAGYVIRVRGTTAPSTAVQLNSLHVAHMWVVRTVPGKAHLEVSFLQKPVLLDANEGIQPYFATASNNNSVEISYQIAP